MNKQCARCSKTVYPLEELKCLDKTWHKGCFKCWECGMTLNMRTYKGFNKFPYCEAHIPKPKATTVAETPEFARIAENTKIQSNVQYHADFEKAKGKYTTVADDPETMRIKEASKIISNVTYHGDLQKKAQMEMRRNMTPENGDEEGNVGPYAGHHQQQHQQPLPPQPIGGNYNRPMNKVLPTANDQGNMADSPYSARQHSTVVYTSQKGAMEQPTGPQRHIGSIADYDPVVDQVRQQHRQMQQQHGGYGGYQQQQQPQHQQLAQHHQPPQQQQHPQQQQQANYHHQQQQQSRGYPASSQPRFASSQPPLDYYAQHHQHAAQQQQQQHHLQQQQQQHHRQPQHGGYAGGGGPASGGGKLPPNLGRCYRAMYDYAAADADEVSFKDGDLIINCSPIDEGWMTGTVQRTMHTGMLPANYVEQIN